MLNRCMNHSLKDGIVVKVRSHALTSANIWLAVSILSTQIVIKILGLILAIAYFVLFIKIESDNYGKDN